MKLQDLKCGQDLIQDSYISTQPPPHPARAHTHTHSLSTQFTFPGHSSGFWEWAGWGGAFITVDHSVTSSRILGVWVASSSSRDCFSETSLISNWRHLNKHLDKPPPKTTAAQFRRGMGPTQVSLGSRRNKSLSSHYCESGEVTELWTVLSFMNNMHIAFTWDLTTKKHNVFHLDCTRGRKNL